MKVSLTLANAANKVRNHLLAKWPELQYAPGIWFSGSQVWSWVYGMVPPETSDTDIFALQDAGPVVGYECDFRAMKRVERTPIGHALHLLGLDPVRAGIEWLRMRGSAAAPGFNKPEGCIISMAAMGFKPMKYVFEDKVGPSPEES